MLDRQMGKQTLWFARSIDLAMRIGPRVLPAVKHQLLYTSMRRARRNDSLGADQLVDPSLHAFGEGWIEFPFLHRLHALALGRMLVEEMI